MAVMQASEANINFVKTRLASPDGKLWGKAPGMVLIKPTSISHTGTSASIGTNGQVTYTSCTQVMVNGVFSSLYDNYVVVIGEILASGEQITFMQLRSNGTNSTTGYTRQFIDVSGTSISAGRETVGSAWVGGTSATARSMNIVNIYGPFLAQPTAFRTVNVMGTSSARIFDAANTHNVSSSYDGFMYTVGASNLSGKLAVYGIRS